MGLNSAHRIYTEEVMSFHSSLVHWFTGSLVPAVQITSSLVPAVAVHIVHRFTSSLVHVHEVQIVCCSLSSRSLVH